MKTKDYSKLEADISDLIHRAYDKNADPGTIIRVLENVRNVEQYTWMMGLIDDEINKK